MIDNISSLKKQHTMNNSFNVHKKMSLDEEIKLVEKKLSFVKIQIDILNSKLKENVKFSFKISILY